MNAFLFVSFTLGLANAARFDYGELAARRWLDQPPTPPIDPLTAEKWFEQKLDHFDPADNRTFSQRYFENFRYYRSCGPIFLTVGGESALSPQTVAHSQMLTTILAQQFGGAIISLEHRNYGQSFTSSNHSDFEFLSSRQAIEDLAVFVNEMNAKLRLSKPRWILFGCSYPGSLATWFKQKHSNLALGAIAVSAPLDVRMDFQEYKKVVSDALWRIDEPCAGRLRDAFQLLNAEMRLKDNWPQVAEELGIPTANSTPPADYDVEAAQSAINTNFLFALGGHVQNKPAESFRKEICKGIVLDMKRPLLQMLGTVGKIESVPEYGINAWTYQLCNEFGWFVTSRSDGQTPKRAFWPDLFSFNITVERASEFCRYALGEDYATHNISTRVEATREYFGDIHELNTTNVIFVRGENDPWGPLQMQSQFLRAGNLLVVVKDATHCATSYSSWDPHTRNAQSLVISQVGEWLRGTPACCFYC